MGENELNDNLTSLESFMIVKKYHYLDNLSNSVFTKIFKILACCSKLLYLNQDFW